MREFIENNLKKSIVLNETVTLTSSTNEVNLKEMDDLVESIVESMK